MSKQLKGFLYGLILILVSFIIFITHITVEQQLNIYVLMLYIVGIIAGSVRIIQVEDDFF
jgi:hypothetical protein